jgi:hypothetical protein
MMQFHVLLELLSVHRIRLQFRRERSQTTLASTIIASTTMAPSITVIVHCAIGSVVAPVPSAPHQSCHLSSSLAESRWFLMPFAIARHIR